MKSKLIVLAMFFVSVATAGVITVSDPGQAQGKLITTRDIVPFVKVTLTASNVSGQVFLTVNQGSNNSCSQIDIDLFAGSMSNKFTGGSAVIGPFTMESGQTSNIVISARVNNIQATNSVALDLASVKGPPGTTVSGTLPLAGTPYVVVGPGGKFTDIKVFLRYSGTPLDTNGIHWDLLYLSVKADPLSLYQIQYSEDTLSWHPISQLFGGVNDKISTGSDGTFSAYYFMRLPPQCFYRFVSTQ